MIATGDQEGGMVRGDLCRADYRAEPVAVLDDKGGVRCELSNGGGEGTITAQLDSVGCVTLTYRASPDSSPMCVFVGFMADLATCDQTVISHADGTLTVE